MHLLCPSLPLGPGLKRLNIPKRQNVISNVITKAWHWVICKSLCYLVPFFFTWGVKWCLVGDVRSSDLQVSLSFPESWLLLLLLMGQNMPNKVVARIRMSAFGGPLESRPHCPYHPYTTPSFIYIKQFRRTHSTG